MLYGQLTKQGLVCTTEYPKDKGYDGVVHIVISPAHGSFSFLTETTSGLPRTLCCSVTEVLKRTWNTWVEKDTNVSFAYKPSMSSKKLVSLMKQVMRRNVKI